MSNNNKNAVITPVVEEVKPIVLKAKADKVRKLKAEYELNTEFGPMFYLDDGLGKSFSFGVMKARKIVEAIDALKQFLDFKECKEYVTKPRVAKASAITQEDISSALASTQELLAKYKK